MTTYEKIAAEACQWCKIGNPVSYQGQHEIFSLGGKNRNQIENYKREPCTAPTKDAVIERLAAENKRLREALEKIIAGAENRFAQDHPSNEYQSLIDHDSGARLAWSVASKLAKAALAAPAQETEASDAVSMNAMEIKE